MLTARVVLIDTTGTIGFNTLTAVASALNLQVQRDLAPIWHVSATVTALPDATQVPLGTWPILLVNNLPPDEGGVHLNQHHQPYALVEAGGPGWTVATSHECLEMLVDPSGSRTHASNAIGIVDGQVRDVPGKFEYVVEVCDPSEGNDFAYEIDDVSVSDFYTPHFFDHKAVAGVRYSFTGALTRPRQVLSNGYLSWINPMNGRIEQLKNFGAPEIVDLGSANAECLRGFIDRKSRTVPEKLSKMPATSPSLVRAQQRGASLNAAARAKATRYNFNFR
jgi:hypothetical protein